MGIILASGSPRRRELLEMLGLEFEVHPAVGGEHPPEHAGPEEIVLSLAGAKAAEVAEHSGAENVIIAADTIVWLDGGLLGKPRDEADAARMLGLLSGREHEVWTGVCVLRGAEALAGAEQTFVKFRELTPETRPGPTGPRAAPRCSSRAYAGTFSTSWACPCAGSAKCSVNWV